MSAIAKQTHLSGFGLMRPELCRARVWTQSMRIFGVWTPSIMENLDGEPFWTYAVYYAYSCNAWVVAKDDQFTQEVGVAELPKNWLVL